MGKYSASTNSNPYKNFEQETHREKVKKLLVKGLCGFVAGILFVLITSLSDQEPFQLSFALVIGLFFSGIPYGWEILGRTFGHWYAIGSIPAMILVLVFQLVGAILIGWVAYPISLLFNLMKSHAQGSLARRIYAILLGIFIAILVAFIAITCWPR